MFLGLLSADEKRAFVTLAEMMVEADGIVVGREMEALETLRREMGLPDLTQVSQPDVDQLVRSFTSRQAKVVALLELLGLGFSDAEFHVDEKSLITVIAHEMDVTADELDRLEEWVRNHVRHISAAMELMQGS